MLHSPALSSLYSSLYRPRMPCLCASTEMTATQHLHTILSLKYSHSHAMTPCCSAGRGSADYTVLHVPAHPKYFSAPQHFITDEHHCLKHHCCSPRLKMPCCTVPATPHRIHHCTAARCTAAPALAACTLLCGTHKKCCASCRMVCRHMPQVKRRRRKDKCF